MPITTVADVTTFTGRAFSADEEQRLLVLIPIAERRIARFVGRVFHDAADPTGDASQDWLLAVSLTAEQMLRDEDPAVRAVRQGPFQSESFGGDHSYTVKSSVASEFDPSVMALLAVYRTGSLLTSVIASGPTRVAVPVFDADVSRGIDA